MNMTDSQIKILLFIFWPVIAAIALAVVALGVVIVWPLIPFSTVQRNDNKINLVLGKTK